MKLIRASFENFRLLRDLELEFSTELKRPLTVIRAANETGKTTILTALQWAFYGDNALPGKSGDYRLHPIDWDSADSRVVNISVTVDFEVSSHRRTGGILRETRRRYRLNRCAMEEISGRRGSTGPAPKSVGSSLSTEDRKLPVSRYPRKIQLKSDQIQSAMENLGQLMEQATLRPHIEEGQPAGISITGIKPNAIFRKMRLRNGDVITGVNGNSIGSVEDATRVFEELSSGSNIQLQIKRRGREQTLDYSIE